MHMQSTCSTHRLTSCKRMHRKQVHAELFLPPQANLRSTYVRVDVASSTKEERQGAPALPISSSEGRSVDSGAGAAAGPPSVPSSNAQWCIVVAWPTLMPVGVSRLNRVALRIWKRVPLSDCRHAVKFRITPLLAAASRVWFLSSWACSMHSLP